MPEDVKSEKRWLDRFVFDGYEELGDRKQYTEVKALVDEDALGPWRYVVSVCVVLGVTSAVWTVINLVLGRGNIGTRLLLIGACVVVGGVVSKVVPLMRRGGEAAIRQVEILREAAGAVVTRLKVERPESDLLKEWSARSAQ